MPLFAAAERRPVLALLLLCAALYLPGLFTLPALDRDEARFAQATTQMLETGDYTVPRFQDDLRAKKPVMIYWMQAATVAVADVFGAGGDKHPGIWAYRIPSVIAAIVTALLTWRIGTLLYGARAGLVAGVLMAASVALVAEANIAKTDAALCASILAAQLALARVWLARDPARTEPGIGNALLFWVALAVGVLLKGPLAPMVCGLTGLALVIASREVRWVWMLRPVSGVVLFLVLTLPWAWAAWTATGGAFFGEAVGGDLVPKLIGGQEKHGAPFGYYLLLVALTFFPGSLLLMPALRRAWDERRTAQVMFLAAWVIPSWLVFEITPTKLPHYVLPLYPALAVMCGAVAATLVAQPDKLRERLMRVSIGIWAVLAVVLAGVMIAAPMLLPEGTAVEPGPWPVVGAGVFLALALRSAAYAWRLKPARALVTLAVAAAAFSLALLEFTRPRLDPLWVAEHVEDALEMQNLKGLPVASAGFSEPSLVFALGTDTLLTDGEGAADWLAQGPDRVVLVETKEAEAFEAAVTARGLTPRPIAEVSGLNYSRGDAVTLTIYAGTIGGL